MRLVKLATAIAFAGMCLLLLTASLPAADKAPSGKPGETGVIKDAVYTDSRYGFSVKFPLDWREAKLRKDPSAERLQLVQRKPRVPLRLQGNPDLALKPAMMIFADSSTMTPEAFFAYLRADTGKIDLKQKILAKSVFLEQGTSNEIQVLDKTTAKVLGKDALKMKVRLEYNVRVESPGQSVPIQVNDFRVGYIYIVPMDGWLLYIEQAAENQFFESLQPDFDTFLNSLTFVKAAGN
jgi:hypothetical protein